MNVAFRVSLGRGANEFTENLDLDDVQDFVLFTNNEYLLVSPLEILSVPLCLPFFHKAPTSRFFFILFCFGDLAKVIKTR